MLKNKINLSRLFQFKNKKLKLNISNLHNLKNKNMFDFSKSKVGIQIGDSKLKVILLQREKNGQWIAAKEITEKLADDLVSEGKILQPEILGFKIKETLANNNIKEKMVSVFIEELPFFVRQIQLPKVPKKELKEAIQYKAQLEFPVDIKDLYLQYSLIDTKIVDGKLQEEYMVIAVYRSLIEKALQTFKQAGLAIETFGLEPEAIYNGLKYKNILDHIEGSLLLVRKDVKRMMLAVYSQDKLMYSRYIPISPVFDDDDNDEITRTILSWNGKHSKDGIKAVALLGEEEIWKRTEMDIKSFMPFLEVKTITSPFTACLGISLTAVMKDHLNISPEKESINFRKNKILLYSFVGIIALLLLFIASAELKLRNDIKALQTNIEESNKLVSLITLREQLIKEKQNLELIQSKSTQDHVNVVPLINKIKKYQPASIELSKIIFSKDLVMLAGTGDTQDAVMTFYKKLQTDKEYANVHLKQSSTSDQDITFTIDIQTLAKGD